MVTQVRVHGVQRETTPIVTKCSVTDLRGALCPHPIDPDADAAMCRSHAEAGWKVIQVLFRRMHDEAAERPVFQWEKRFLPSAKCPDHEPVVYFVRVQNRIKIGTTRQMTKRMAAIHADEVLATIRGNRSDETALHQRFKHLRIRGEYFEPAPELLEFINKIK